MVNLVMASLIGPPVVGQDTPEELRKAAQNPVASVVKLPIEQDIFFTSGVYDRILAQLQVQPVIPFLVAKDWLLVPRIVAGLLMGADGGFITGSDFLMDGGVTAAYWYGELAPR
jgi:hypothetical protein